MITGILSVDKPLAWTSHDVVGRVRRVAGQRQVGHAGTLDPLATGVLVVMLGTATRLSSYLMGTPKAYRAEIVLGVTTVTDDAEAPVRTQCDVSCLLRSDIERCLQRFVGELAQVPPRYAAVKRGGEKLYTLARQGVEIAAEPRQVIVHEIDLEDWTPPRLRLAVRCGPGTYIRSLARDIGSELGVGGYVHALRRTASGTFTARESHSMDDLQSVEAICRWLQPPDRAILDWPAVVLTELQVRSVRFGQPVATSRLVQGRVRLYDGHGTLIALGNGEEGRIKPFRVLAGG